MLSLFLFNFFLESSLDNTDEQDKGKGPDQQKENQEEKEDVKEDYKEEDDCTSLFYYYVKSSLDKAVDKINNMEKGSDQEEENQEVQKGEKEDDEEEDDEWEDILSVLSRKPKETKNVKFDILMGDGKTCQNRYKL